MAAPTANVPILATHETAIYFYKKHSLTALATLMIRNSYCPKVEHILISPEKIYDLDYLRRFRLKSSFQTHFCHVLQSLNPITSFYP